MTVGTDDTQPLLRSVTNEGHQVYTDPDPAPALQDGTTNTNLAVGTTIVDFDPNGDAENPLEWPTPFKWAVVSMLAVMAFTVYISILFLFYGININKETDTFTSEHSLASAWSP
jgi:hypothetical protein